MGVITGAWNLQPDGPYSKSSKSCARTICSPFWRITMPSSEEWRRVGRGRDPEHPSPRFDLAPAQTLQFMPIRPGPRSVVVQAEHPRRTPKYKSGAYTHRERFRQGVLRGHLDRLTAIPRDASNGRIGHPLIRPDLHAVLRAAPLTTAPFSEYSAPGTRHPVGCRPFRHGIVAAGEVRRSLTTPISGTCQERMQ